METKQDTTVKSKLRDIILDISVANLSKKYFGKSRSWLHHKLDGTDSKGGLTAEETETLKLSLKDLAKRIDECANKL